MSSYKVVLKPGGVGGRNVGVGLKLQRIPRNVPLAGPNDPVAPASTKLDVSIVYPTGMTGHTVTINGPNGFSETISADTTFTPIAAGEYSISAAAVSGHTVRIFTSPTTVPDGATECVLVVYDVEGTGGGGGDCTPTCVGFRWIPINQTVTWTNNIAELDLLPDSMFTEDYSNILTDLGGLGTVVFLAARFMGQVCQTSRLVSFGGYQGSQSDQNGYASINANALVIGRTLFASLSLARPSVGTAGTHNAGIYSMGGYLAHPDVNSVFQNVCTAGEIYGDFTFTFNNGE